MEIKNKPIQIKIKVKKGQKSILQSAVNLQENINKIKNKKEISNLNMINEEKKN